MGSTRGCGRENFPRRKVCLPFSLSLTFPLLSLPAGDIKLRLLKKKERNDNKNFSFRFLSQTRYIHFCHQFLLAKFRSGSGQYCTVHCQFSMFSFPVEKQTSSKKKREEFPDFLTSLSRGVGRLDLSSTASRRFKMPTPHPPPIRPPHAETRHPVSQMTSN